MLWLNFLTGLLKLAVDYFRITAIGVMLKIQFLYGGIANGTTGRI